MAEERHEMGLKAAMQIGMYYAYLAQVLRMVINPEGPVELPEELLNQQLDQLREHLANPLARNRVVKQNIEQIDKEVLRIRREAGHPETWGAAVKEAKRMLPEVEIRAKTVSDLVALLRGG
ncbi:MAG: hypothetical protein EPO39_00040 [Candidatus Manganitrophaceae bacterium]|nr:MAG: hypothetical protein EPO39_00040 [Candidatus Manganitrophaceae bacterium]